MNQVIHSSFLQALGYAIINSLWQFALLWLLYFLINTVFKLTSKHKYVSGLVLQIAGFTWFIATLIFYYIQSSAFLTGNNVYSDYIGVTNSNGDYKQYFYSLFLQSEKVFPYLSIAYLGLLFVLSVKCLYAYKTAQAVKKKGLIKIEVAWRLFVQKLSLELGINRNVKIYLSDLIQTPLTIGFFKPLILIPLATVNYLNTQQMEAVILHELAHIKRLDYLFNLLLALIEAALFFNPFMQLMNKHIKRERENCCDDWVIKYDYNPHSYARALLQIASRQTCSPLLAVKATGDKHLLLNRIKRLIEKKERSFFKYKQQVTALLVMTLVLSSLTLLSTKRNSSKAFALTKKTTAPYKPLAAEIDNPLFNPAFFLVDSAEKLVEQKVDADTFNIEKTTANLVRFPAKFFHNPFARIDETRHPATALTPSGKEALANAFNLHDLLINVQGAEPQNTEDEQEAPVLQNLKIANEKPESELQKQFIKSAGQLNIVLNNTANEEQLKNALSQIKTVRNKLELLKRNEIIKEVLRNIQKQKISADQLGAFNEKAKEFELMAKQFELQMETAKGTIFYSINENPIASNSDVPPVFYTTPAPEKEHSFSFEYSTAPAIAEVRPVTSYYDVAPKKKNRKVTVTEEGKNELAPNIHEPLAEPKKVRIRIIKI